MLLNKILRVIYSIYIFIIIVLPSGNVGNINIKIILTAILTLLIVFDIAARTYVNKKTLISIYIFLTIVVFLLIWSIVGLLKYDDNYFGLMQLKDFISTIYIVWIGYYLYNNNIMKWLDYYYLVISSHLIYIISKLVIFILIVLNVVSLNCVVTFVKDVFGVSIVSFSFDALGAARLDLLNDTLSPFLLLFILNPMMFKLNIKPTAQFLSVVLIIVNTIIGFKRTLIALTLIFLLYSVTSLMGIRKSITVFIVLLASITVLYTCFNNEIDFLVKERFNSISQADSDKIRNEQIIYLLDEFYDNIFIGKGLGGYAKSYIRSDDLPYSYEVQWLAILMQFGVLGFFLVVLIYLSVVSPLFVKSSYKCLKIKATLLFIYLMWGLISFSNPMLLSSLCSAFYTIILIASIELSKELLPNSRIENKFMDHSLGKYVE
jgi:hypothetical protein